MTSLDPIALVRELTAHPKEEIWFEFKVDWFDPHGIGEYISALSNSAALAGRERGYLVWGVEDGSHQFVGTGLHPELRKGKGNEDLVPWLHRHLKPCVDFAFSEGEEDGKRVVVLAIPAAKGSPTAFDTIRRVRVGSHNKTLMDFPDLERRLFETLRNSTYEAETARSGLSADEVIGLLDYTMLFRLLNRPLPHSPDQIREELLLRDLIRREDDGRWSVTNLGGILLARDLADFGALKFKRVRLVQFAGRTKTAMRAEIELPASGYAVVFENLLAILRGLLPGNEAIEGDLRHETEMYPAIALRELVANAVVHQDFAIRGSGPMIELFSDRLVIRSPGAPPLPPDRFLDKDRARNERLVELMRLMRICEKSGSGVDKVVEAIELWKLPALEIRKEDGDENGSEEIAETVVTLFPHKPYKDMEVSEKVEAAYWHAAFLFNQKDRMSNASFRGRLGLPDGSSSAVSVVIARAIQEGRIRAEDPSVGNKAMRYVPWWA